ncbi:MAG: hypothetical protein FHK79_21920 [Pseudomonas sp.]|nr:MAG: hypothetical protein FHK79_21920 [Pseudomonas sp.]
MSSHLTPDEILAHNLCTVKTACAALRQLQHNRASGALSALFNLGLIDLAAYRAAGKALDEAIRLNRTEPRA